MYQQIVSTCNRTISRGWQQVLHADNVDLGTACGRLYRVGVLAITDAGDSDIIKNVSGEQ